MFKWFELYSRWVPLNRLTLNRLIDRMVQFHDKINAISLLRALFYVTRVFEQWQPAVVDFHQRDRCGCKPDLESSQRQMQQRNEVFLNV